MGAGKVGALWREETEGLCLGSLTPTAEEASGVETPRATDIPATLPVFGLSVAAGACCKL